MPTPVDIFFMVMVAIDLLAICAMVFAAMQMRDAVSRGRHSVDPAIREARALADHGKTLTNHAKKEGQAMYGRVKGVMDKVQHRVETTKRIARELKPQAATTTEVAKSTRTDMTQRARSVGDLARRLTRVKEAAKSAARAARTS